MVATEGVLLEDELTDEEVGILSDELSEDDAQFVSQLIPKIIQFGEVMCGTELFDYQYAFAWRIFESLIINDAEDITACFARQSGKTETVAFTIATAMVLFPRFAKHWDLFKKFKKGVMVGVFAPVDEQAETLFGRVVGFLTNENALEVLEDSEIDDAVDGKSKIITLTKSGSFCRQQTANKRAKIESKSYHIVYIDEAQDVDEFTFNKSISPMLAFYNGTKVFTGTPARVKGMFYRTIQFNRRRETRRGARQNHFQVSWRTVARSNHNYERYVTREIAKLGEHSDEVKLSFECVWLLERGMFVSESWFQACGDTSMNIETSWTRTPCVVGIDPARIVDSTVVTVCFVDWSRPDEFGFMQHRPINWLELEGDDWEEQYFQILDFLSHYWVTRIGVDSQGVGDAVASRLRVLLPTVDVISMPSTLPEQSKRWKHLMQLIQKGMFIYPAHSKTRRLLKWRRFVQQMTDLEKVNKGAHLLAAAPEDDAEAHDDYADSAALACACTIDMSLPEVEEGVSPFHARR